MKKRIGLALGGGGARGIAHLPYIQALDALGLKPHIISGTSIGAIVGGFYASGMSGNKLEKLIKSIGFKELTQFVDLSLLSDRALLKGKGVEEFLEEHIGVTTFEALSIPLKIVATDFWNRKPVVMDSGKLIPAIRASISLPAVFEPVKHDKQVLVDGGALNPVPYDVIRDFCDVLIAIDVNGTRTPSAKHRLPNMFDNIMGTFETMQTSIEYYKQLVYPPDLVVKPPLVNIGVLDFHRADAILKNVRPEIPEFKKQVLKLTRPEKKKRWFSFFSLP